MTGFTENRTGHGVSEWAEMSANIQTGCANSCKYCFARANALRFGKISTSEEWAQEKINYDQVNKRWRKRKGVIMFPTAHDITPANVSFAESCKF